MIMVDRNMNRRPILSDSQPPSSAPITAPPCVPAAAKPEQQRIGMKLVADEDEDEGDPVEVPGLHQDRGHHQPADAVALRTVVGDEMTNCGVHRGFLRH